VPWNVLDLSGSKGCRTGWRQVLVVFRQDVSSLSMSRATRPERRCRARAELNWRSGRKATVGELLVFQPAVAKGRVYVSTTQGTLVCLETGDPKDDGRLMWGATAAHNGLATREAILLGLVRVRHDGDAQPRMKAPVLKPLGLGERKRRVPYDFLGSVERPVAGERSLFPPVSGASLTAQSRR
jgi:hypothetical protein